MRSVKRVTKANINKQINNSLSREDLMNLLDKKTTEVWSTMTNGEKYGCFYKCLYKNDKYVFSTISEPLDDENMRRIDTYIFG